MTFGTALRKGGTHRGFGPYPTRATMTELKISYLSNHTPGPEDTTAAFVRPLWASRPSRLGDSTPNVTTAELRRPVFKTSDSTPSISTADLQRPRWPKASGVLGNERIA